MTHLFHNPSTFEQGAAIIRPKIGLGRLLKDMQLVIKKTTQYRLSFHKKFAFIGLFIISRYSYWYGFMKRKRSEATKYDERQ